jgi:hypothetical protein
MGGPAEIYAGVFGDLDLLDEPVRASFLGLIALAPTLERRHRRIALVRDLTSHLVEDSAARWIRTISS